ncbi:MAG: adenylate/guanylate cyclase domain-containing protein [Actinomycetospora chiangmaiensis]|nr:adenylate/guanylate cyclase domain-containing protein [Actinomycetospora chiangmaiensis]
MTLPARAATPEADEAAALRTMQEGGGPRLMALRIVIVLVMLMAAQAYDGSLHALSHWFILALYGIGTVWFGLAERRGGRAGAASAWAGTGLNAVLATYVIVEHMMAGGGTGEGADTVSRLPAFLLLLQTGLTMQVSHTLLFCGLVTGSWVVAFLIGLTHPGLFPGFNSDVTMQVIGLASFVAAGLLVIDGVVRLRRAVSRTLEAERERGRLARFVPTTVARDLASDALGLHRRHACLLILDIRGFSALSRCHPPEEMVAALMAVRAQAQGAVAAEGGIVDKYIGDAVLAQFITGSPEAQARAAAACAVDIQTRLTRINAERESAGLFPIRTATALHAGDLLVGVFDDGVRAEYTVLGPAMNTLARIETRAKAADLAVAASEEIVRLLGGPLREPFRPRPVPGTAGEGQGDLYALALPEAVHVEDRAANPIL